VGFYEDCTRYLFKRNMAKTEVDQAISTAKVETI
jgi:hypothetical protein